jgi:hypothetical protein
MQMMLNKTIFGSDLVQIAQILWMRTNYLECREYLCVLSLSVVVVVNVLS